MPTRILGIDPENNSLKIVEVLQSFRKMKVVKATTTDDLDSYISAMNNEQISTIMAPFSQELVTNRLTHFPFVSSKKLEQTTPFELESWVPFSVEDFIIDYQVVKKEKNTSMVLISGTRKENVRNWISKWEEKGLNPHSAVPEGIAYRNLSRLVVKDQETPLAFLNIGETRSVLAITRGDRAVLARSLPGGVESFEQVLVSERKDSDKKAQKAVAIEKTASNGNAVPARVMAEIKNTLRYISVEEGIEVSKLFLCGHAEQIKGLPEFLAEKLGFEVSLWFAPPELETDLGPEYALALAVALEQSHPSKGINLRKDEFAHRAESRGVGTKVVFPSLIAAAIIILILVNVLFKNRELQAQAATLDAKIAVVAGGVLGDNKISPQNALTTLNQQLDDIKKMEESIGKTDYLTPLQTMTALSKYIPETVNIDIEELTLNDKLLTITGIVPDYSQMDLITNALQGFKVFKKFEPPSLKERIDKKGGVQFTLKILLTEEKEEQPGK